MFSSIFQRQPVQIQILTLFTIGAFEVTTWWLLVKEKHISQCIYHSNKMVGISFVIWMAIGSRNNELIGPSEVLNTAKMQPLPIK